MAPDGAVGAYEAMTPSSRFALNGPRRTVDGEDMTVRSRWMRYTANRARAYLTHKPYLLSRSLNFESKPLILKMRRIWPSLKNSPCISKDSPAS